MDKFERAQIRLLLEHLGAARRDKTAARNKAMLADHSAKHILQSGATVKAALSIAEEIATAHVTNVVAAVADVAKDMDAFNMIVTDVTIMFQDLQPTIDQAVRIANVRSSGDQRSDSVRNSANQLFRELQVKTLRLLEIHRFSFTRPSPNNPSNLHPDKLSSAPQPAKNRGGKPLAAHWDEMWASVAVRLWLGDLEPTSQADVSRAMLDWFTAAGIDVGETTVRGRARQLWQKFEDAKLSGS